MKKELLIIIAAVCMGIAAIVFNIVHRKEVETEVRSQISNQITVCRVTRRVSPNVEVKEDMLEAVDMPAAFAHPLSIQWSDRTRIYGRKIRSPLMQRQPLLWSDLSDGVRQTVGDSILPGRGLVTIPVDRMSSASGMIQPGARVDVLGIFPKLTSKNAVPVDAKGGDSRLMNSLLMKFQSNSVPLPGNEDFFIITVARNLNVFAVGSHTLTEGGRGVFNYGAISFDVPPQLQALLIMAQEKAEREGGRLLCVLRSNESTSREIEEQPDVVYSSTEFLSLINSTQEFKPADGFLKADAK